MDNSPSSHRQGINKSVSLATGVNMSGLLAHRADHRLVTQGQFPEHLAERVKATLMLARSAHYLKFAYDGGPVCITVGGAAYQDRSCASGTTTKDQQGRTQYSGLQAGHVRLGSYSLNGESAAFCWHQKLIELATKNVLNPVEASQRFIGHDHWMTISYLFDGRTHPVDALVNQVFGTIESRLHPQLNVLNLSFIPTEASYLRIQMEEFSDSYMKSMPNILLQIAKERSVDIQRDPSKDRMQQDVFIDGFKPTFKSESELLEGLISELQSPVSHTNQLLDKQRDSIAKGLDFEMPLAELAQEEAQGI